VTHNLDLKVTDLLQMQYYVPSWRAICLR